MKLKKLNNKTVYLEVEGGVVYVNYVPKGLKVMVKDFDDDNPQWNELKAYEKFQAFIENDNF